MKGIFSHLALCAALVSATGCLYLDSINTPPQAEIEVTQERDYFRGEQISFSAGKSSDTDGDGLFYRFAAEVCGSSGAVCAPLTDLAADLSVLRIDLPTTVPGRDDVAVDVVRAMVTVTDGRGAISIAEASWPVGNAPPTVQLQAQSDYERGDNQFPVTLPIQIVALVGDTDDDPADTVLEWRISDRPLQSQTGQYSFEELTGPTVLDPAYELVPDVPGAWEVTVAATDTAGTTIEETITLTVTGDAAPCITGISRDAGIVHLLDADATPVEFAVLQVIDEFDPFPGGQDGAAEFRWFISAPGSVELVATGADSPGFTIDPTQYAPGDAFQLRIEALDRVVDHEPSCAVDQPTCSFDSNSCLQRLTWSIEIR